MDFCNTARFQGQLPVSRITGEVRTGTHMDGKIVKSGT